MMCFGGWHPGCPFPNPRGFIYARAPVLFRKNSANTGNVCVGRILYHYAGRDHVTRKVPSFDTDRKQTAKSRAMIEEFLRKTTSKCGFPPAYPAGILGGRMAPSLRLIEAGE